MSFEKDPGVTFCAICRCFLRPNPQYSELVDTIELVYDIFKVSRRKKDEIFKRLFSVGGCMTKDKACECYVEDKLLFKNIETFF